MGPRCDSDLVLLWLWHRPAAAAPIRPLAWELPHAAGAALKKQKQTNERIELLEGIQMSEILMSE